MALVAGLIAWFLFLSYKKREQAGREIMAAIEKGIDVPFPSLGPSLHYRNRGILWTSLGVTAIAVLWAMSGEIAEASFGLIPTAFGVASLLIAWSNDHEAGKS